MSKILSNILLINMVGGNINFNGRLRKIDEEEQKK